MSGEPVDEVLVTAMAEAIHATECTAYIHEGRNGVCERQARAAVPAVERILTDRLAAQSEQAIKDIAAAWAKGRAEVAAMEALAARAVERIRHDHAYPMEVGPHHCDGCDLEAELRAALGSGS